MILLLTDPVDTLCPLRLRLDTTATRTEQIVGLWRSPNGNFCVGVSFLADESRRADFTILAYRTAEVIP